MNREFAILVCKVFGPIIIFVGTPLMLFVLYGLTQNDLAAGVPINLIIQKKGFVFFITFIISMTWLGVYACQKGLGWFGGKK